MDFQQNAVKGNEGFKLPSFGNAFQRVQSEFELKHDEMRPSDPRGIRSLMNK